MYVYIYICMYIHMDYTPLSKWDAHPSMIYPEIGDNNMRRLGGVVVAANWKTQQLSAVSLVGLTPLTIGTM